MIRNALALAALLGASPFQAEQPEVRAGNDALDRDPAEALRRYGAAEAKTGPRAEIDFDRGHALSRAGRPADAVAAFQRAAGLGENPLASRALQNAGHLLAEAGDPDAALAAYREALARDPSNGDARWDLEVLLRRRSAGKKARRDPGEKTKAGEEREPADASARPHGGRPKPDEGNSAMGERGEASGAGEVSARKDANEKAAPSRQDADRLLDALRARERTAPPWQAVRRDRRRGDVEKDW